MTRVGCPSIEAIERAGLASWPALQEQRLDGWLLRASHGYTRRTNSASTAGATAERLGADLPLIERFFAQRSLPATFRLLSTPHDEAIDHALARQGYTLCEDPCSVMVRPLPGDIQRPSTSAFALWPDAETWLPEFVRISGDEGRHQRTHLAILNAIGGATAFAVVKSPGALSFQGCGLGVVSDGHLGLFDIATHPDHRRQGLGKALCEGLLGWACGQGAHTAYLQVLAGNRSALELYRRLGFEERYRYWYRTRG